MWDFDKVTEKELREIVNYFDEEKLFYKTKRPATLRTLEIKKLLTGTVGIFEDGKIVGLVSDKLSDLDSKTLDVNLSIVEDTDYKNNAERVFDYLVSRAEDRQCKYIKITIFSFDENTKKFLELMNFKKNATLYGSVYKAGKYHSKEIYIYCLGDKKYD
ncbi:hypothetical protein [Abyssisolibacter fermentans]|uniref:hypothetical protein n=1 Tax=Abyssisolibacter fermentans TaxID=1766203 RepID=UPI000835C96F|nr:hypothetical protein [Abyssisolibacter fermentans]